MSVQSGHAAFHPTLDATLADLQADIRAESVRLVDGRTAELLGVAGQGRRDDVAGLVHLAGVALPITGPDGGLHDLVVSAAHATHVLAPGPFTTLLLVRLGPEADLAVARRALAAPGLLPALHAALTTRGPQVPTQRQGRQGQRGQGQRAQGGPGQPMLRAIPTQREPLPRRVVRDGQPALAALTVVPDERVSRTGELAALALGEVAPVHVPDAVLPLPRRPAPPRAADPLARVWSRDVQTMMRLLDGLRRLA